MKTHIWLTLKYWRKHKKNAAALLFAGVLLTAVVFVTLMTERERWVRMCHSNFDYRGHFDYIFVNSDDELYSKITAGKEDYNYGVINVYGKIGTDKKQFTYGTIDDEYDIMHIPFDEGRLPETDTEIAASVKALNAWHWVGKCGDTITLDGNTYTVVGIIGEDYSGRYGIDEELRRFTVMGPNKSPYRVPSVFVGESDNEPLYRIDMFNNYRNTPRSSEFGSEQEYFSNIYDEIESASGWIWWESETSVFDGSYETDNAPFFIIIAWIGSVIAVLSVYSILKNVFADRQSRIETLKKIGMSKRSVGCMYVVECAVFTLIQTVIGLAIGLGVYGGIFRFKTSVLGEKPYSGFTDIKRALDTTVDPFLFACVISAVIMVTAYILCALTAKAKKKTPKKGEKPRSLSRCFGRTFSQRGVSVVQTVALTLICFSAIMGYMFNTDNGKTVNEGPLATYLPQKTNYYAGSFDMEEMGIEEYYSCVAPTLNGIGVSDNMLLFAPTSYNAGIDDAVADKLPETALITGKMTHTFIVSNEPNYKYINGIDLTDEEMRQALLVMSDEEYRNFFEDGQLGSKSLYQADIKLAPARTVESVSESVRDGVIDIDALNSGEEIIVTYQGKKPPFEAGETVTIGSVAASGSGYGIGGISTAEVKIGAILQLNNDIGAVKNYTLRSEQQYNFLTTATGANAMGLHCSRYTEIYASEPIDGGIIPSSAEMTVQFLAKLKRETAKERILSISGMILILVLMVLMGFAAYFNGIGMKIRAKSYEISVLRAVGTPVFSLRKRILLESIRIPVIASAMSYGLVKLVQLIMGKVNLYMVEFYDHKLQVDGGIIITITGEESRTDWENAAINFLQDKVFIHKGMWMVNAEIPALILFAAICAVTFILTAIALRKFRGNIAGDLNEGRKR